MAARAQLVKHLELYVDSSSSPAQQAASVDSLAILLKNGLLTLEALVREMDLYLTTTDNIIRSRGILLLGESLIQLELMPLNDGAIHSLITFFTERLEDWKALHGALVGCLALMRRKTDVGAVKDSDAKALTQMFMQSLQVQSLGQYDRKLCYELLECLLERYSNAVRPLGDELLYAICEGIDEEKDPQCLVLAFHIVEVAGQLFPDPSGPFASYAAELFEILGSYFPIHFTHPKGEDVGISRDELSRALMLAFGSTPIFEPYAIPLLIDKLSSSLPSTKVESLKYLVYCALKYGSDRMAKHAKELWSMLKDVLYTTPQSTLSMESESFGGLVFEESDIMIQALILLQELTQENGDLFLKLILGDEDVNVFIKSVTQRWEFDDIPLQIEQRLHSVGRLLSVSAKSSIASCNRLFEKFFPSLVEALGISVGNNSEGSYMTETGVSRAPNYGALYLCVELLDACRNLVLGFKEVASLPDITGQTWCSMLQGYCSSLTVVFLSSMEVVVTKRDKNAFAYSGAKGLQILATFPESSSLVSSHLFENILLKLVSTITSDFNKAFLWKLKLKSLLEIGLFSYHYESDKASSFDRIVVEHLISLMSFDDPALPLPLKLEAVFEIGMTAKSNMLRVIQGMDKAISANLTHAYVKRNLESVELMIKLLECYSTRILPWLEDNGGSEEVALNFAATFWEHIESCSLFNLILQNNELLSATIMALKEAVRCCSCEGQEKVILKAFRVLSGNTFCSLNNSPFPPSVSKSDGFYLVHYTDSNLLRDDWFISLFASVIIALRPQTCIQNVKMITEILITHFGRGHILSGQALGSLVNKLPLKNSAKDLSKECYVEDALDMIFTSSAWNLCKSDFVRKCSESADGSEIYFSNSLSGLKHAPFHICAIVGLAWIGKGLIMRGHEKVKDIALAFLGYLIRNADSGDFSQLYDPMEGFKDQTIVPLMRSAADAFHILMSDSDTCLNRKYYAVIRPLHKQRFFNTMMPILSSLMMPTNSLTSRSMLTRTLVHIVSEAPHSAIISEAKKLIPLLLNGFSTLTEDTLNKDVIYRMLLVLSGILMDKNGQGTVEENANAIINQLIELALYPHMMVIRETAIQCLSAVSRLPHARIYPLRTKVLQAISKSLDDPKRAVRQEAVRCRQAWFGL